MENTYSNTKLQGQIQSLHSSNKNAILGTLKELRSKGSVSILAELFQVMLVQEDEQILGEIAALLNDLKDQEAAEVLAAAIANPEYASIHTQLVAACWQNGLSYGEYVDTFVQVAIGGSFETAIEAFTVLEESVGELEKEDRLRLTADIKDGLAKADDQKQLLLKELIKIIQTY